MLALFTITPSACQTRPPGGVRFSMSFKVWSPGFSRRGVRIITHDQNAYERPGWSTPCRLKPGLHTRSTLTNDLNHTALAADYG